MLNDTVLNTQKRNIWKNLIFSIAVVGASLFTTLMLTTQNSQAAIITKGECDSSGGTYTQGNPNTPTSCKQTPDNQIKSYSYYNALSQCARMSQWNASIPTSDVSSPTKWLGDSGISVGYLIDSQDGLLSCKEMIVGALKTWGYTTTSGYEKALKDFGYKQLDIPDSCQGYADSSDCQGGTAWVRSSNMLASFQNGIQQRFGETPTLEGKPDLLYRRGIFHLENSSACNAKPLKKVSDLSAEEQNKYPNNNNLNADGSWKDYLIVKVVNGSNWETEDWVYTIPTDNFVKQIKLNEKPSGGSVDTTCLAIARDQAGYSTRASQDALAMLAAGQDPGSKYGLIVSTPGNSGTTGPGTEGAAASESQSTCTVEGIGWIVCPVMVFMGGLVDAAYNFVASLLEVQPILTTGGTAGLYEAWVVMRNIANVAFVISFLIIIFSQLTSVGVSNYGVKKLLPRLVIAAILVNISFWVCAIAVDLSNILGASMVRVFESIGTSIPNTNLAGGISNELATGGTWSGIVGGVLAGAAVAGAVYYVGLSALIPGLLAALLAIITVFLVLTLRQALIILLIVISPLAFIAFLLPNTEDLFSKWRKLLTTLLLMYPIIAAIFGASALASSIVMNSSDNTVIQIMGAAIAILPLAVTPLVMKTAGGLLNRFGGIVNNAEKGPFDRLRKSGEAYSKDRQNIRNARALNGNSKFGRSTFIKMGARRNAIRAGREAEMNRTNTTYMANQLENNEALRNKVAGGTAFTPAVAGGDQRALANAINTNLKLETEEVNAAKAVIENANLSGDERQKLATEGKYERRDTAGKIIATYSGHTMQKAALQEQLRTGSMSQIHEIVEGSGGDKLKSFAQTISSGIASNGVASKNPALGGKTIDAIAQGRVTGKDALDNIVLGAIKEGKYNAENMASMHDDSRERAIKLAIDQKAAGDSTYYNALLDAKNKLFASSELSAKVGGNERAKKQFDEIV